MDPGSIVPSPWSKANEIAAFAGTTDAVKTSASLTATVRCGAIEQLTVGTTGCDVAVGVGVEVGCGVAVGFGAGVEVGCGVADGFGKGVADGVAGTGVAVDDAVGIGGGVAVGSAFAAAVGVVDGTIVGITTGVGGITTTGKELFAATARVCEGVGVYNCVRVCTIKCYSCLPCAA